MATGGLLSRLAGKTSVSEAASPLMNSGVVPQQPPTNPTPSSLTMAESSETNSSTASVYTICPSMFCGMPALG